VVAEQLQPAAAPLKWDDFVLHIFPENIVRAIGDNQILQVAVFAILFGIALTRVPEKSRQPILSVAESLTQTMFRFTNIVMYYAPIGVGAAMAYTVGHMGMSVLLPLAKLLLTAWGGLLAFRGAGLPPDCADRALAAGAFFESRGGAATIAFATSTSEAALPRAMESMEELACPGKSSPLLSPRATASIWTARHSILPWLRFLWRQAAGIPMSWTQQLFMVFALMLTSKGVAGVPRAVLVVLLATAATFHLPTEPIFIILGVDALIDMARTSVNVIGNCLASAVIARWEGELPPASSSAGTV